MESLLSSGLDHAAHANGPKKRRRRRRNKQGAGQSAQPPHEAERQNQRGVALQLDVEAPRTIGGFDAEQTEAMVKAYMCHAPMALTLREINRLLAIESLAPTVGGRVLDVGCGDGFWWTIRDRRDCAVYGVDINVREIALASSRINAQVCDVAKLQPFPNERFDEIIGNCSLEHVHDLEAALRNLRRCAAPGARLVLFVPSQMWAYQGHLQRALLRRAPRLGMALGGLMNGFFQHWHVYDVPQWQRLLQATGWNIAQARGLGNPRSEFIFRLLLPQAFGSFLLKQATGEYPSRLLGHLPENLLQYPVDLLTWALQDPLVDADAPTAYEYMLVAEANDDG